MSLRLIQSFQKAPTWFKRLAIGDANSGTPVLAPLYLKPTAVPSGTAAKGDVYFNTTNGELTAYDGTNWRMLNGYHMVSYPILAASVDTPFFIAHRAFVVVSAKEIHSVVGSTSAAVAIKKCTGTTVPASGTNIATGSFDLTATINTTQTLTLSATAADYTLAAGDKLSLDFSGTLTGLVGVVTVVLRAA